MFPIPCGLMRSHTKLFTIRQIVSFPILMEGNKLGDGRDEHGSS